VTFLVSLVKYIYWLLDVHADAEEMLDSQDFVVLLYCNAFIFSLWLFSLEVVFVLIGRELTTTTAPFRKLGYL